MTDASRLEPHLAVWRYSIRQRALAVAILVAVRRFCSRKSTGTRWSGIDITDLAPAQQRRQQARHLHQRRMVGDAPATPAVPRVQVPRQPGDQPLLQHRPPRGAAGAAGGDQASGVSI